MRHARQLGQAFDLSVDLHLELASRCRGVRLEPPDTTGQCGRDASVFRDATLDLHLVALGTAALTDATDQRHAIG